MSPFVFEQPAQFAKNFTNFGYQGEFGGEQGIGENFVASFTSAFGENEGCSDFMKSPESDHEKLSEGNDVVENFAMLGVDTEDDNQQEYFDDHAFLPKMLATAEEIPVRKLLVHRNTYL